MLVKSQKKNQNLNDIKTKDDIATDIVAMSKTVIKLEKS